ncbi:MAG: DUF6175 family protein [Prevotellaceae bacterium]|jgi:hypothetical protein|nr:DUF6175 family protein [Prevotellaceae bacterium]
MKKAVLNFIGLFFCLSLLGQAKKPTLMVVPSNEWCTQNGYMMEFDNQGTTELLPDFKLALQTNFDLNKVITKIGGLMAEKGFPLVDLSASISNLERSNAMNRAVQSKNSGALIVETPLDMLKRQAKSDIILEINWKLISNGPKKTIDYYIRGIDAYTNKQIADGGGAEKPSFAAEVSVLLEEAVLSNMDNFAAKLQTHFDDLFANGREVTVGIQVFENAKNIDLETEFDGMELSEIINDWMAQNTVKHRFNKSNASAYFIRFEQVRIPLYREDEMPMDTEDFVRNLMRFLRAAPYNLTSKIEQRGLGECILIIGNK